MTIICAPLAGIGASKQHVKMTISDAFAA